MTQQQDILTPHGYHGRYLRIDVGTGRHESIPLPDHVLRSFLGGTGLGVYLMFQERQATVDAFDPAAALAFTFSPLVGSPLTTSAKFAVINRSPLTQQYNDSLASSGFAIAGKNAGWDAIVLTGQAASPSIVIIDDDQIRIENADDVWGLPVSAAEQQLRERLGKRFRCATIGPAGEKLVRFATISHDGRHAGRGGSGAILGAKNLKSIAVAGTQQTPWADAPALHKYSKDLSKRSFGPATAKYRELGTAANMLTFNRLQALPTRNFQRSRFEEAEQLAPETLGNVRNKTRHSCVACTIGCEHVYKLNQDKGNGVRVEYENLFALGSLCEVGNADDVLQASRLCDELGIDTISAGGTIAFAMECVERKLLDQPWLEFGSGTALRRAIEMIGAREGIGDDLAEGSRLLAKKFGPEAETFAPHVKGLEIPGYEPRALQTMALGFAVGTRGADHNRSGGYEADFSDRVDRYRADARSITEAIRSEDQAALMDSLILCKFLRRVFDDFFAESATMLKLVTGWDITTDELQTTAKRIITAKKLFNIRAGWQPADDILPARFLQTHPQNDPDAMLSSEQLRDLVDRYNRSRGWSTDGWIESDSLTSLNLDKLLPTEISD